MTNDNSTQLQEIEQIYLKREDQNTTGSVKYRGLLQQIEAAVPLGHTEFVLSSSGNAGIAAAHICNKFGYKLTVFVSKNINQAKLKKLQQFNCNVVTSIGPLNDSLKYADEINAYHLRQSTDPYATIGYRDIAHELVNQLVVTIPPSEQQNIAIFLPVSSGTTLMGVYEGFLEQLEEENIASLPQLHAVQTAAVHPIARAFDSDFRRKSSSIVDSIVPPLNPPRKDAVIAAIRKSKGSGWIVNDDIVISEHEELLSHDIETSYEGALALAAYKKSKNRARIIKYPIIVCTGTIYTSIKHAS